MESRIEKYINQYENMFGGMNSRRGQLRADDFFELMEPIRRAEKAGELKADDRLLSLVFHTVWKAYKFGVMTGYNTRKNEKKKTSGKALVRKTI